MPYKGFNNKLQCRNFQYAEGETYNMDGNIVLCKKGFHYCDKLSDVFTYYERTNSKFALVQPLGDIDFDSNKSVTNKLKILKVLTDKEINEILADEQFQQKDDTYLLDVIKELQSKYNISVGGSVALFLSGFDLNRNNGCVDLDLIVPYYQKLRIADFKDSKVIQSIEETQTRSSGADFKNTFLITTKKGKYIKVDVCVAPTQPHNFVTYKNHEYKINDIMTILEAKCRYAMKGNSKHREDILRLMKGKTVSNSVSLNGSNAGVFNLG
jgi:hypothetical protein